MIFGGFHEKVHQECIKKALIIAVNILLHETFNFNFEIKYRNIIITVIKSLYLA